MHFVDNKFRTLLQEFKNTIDYAYKRAIIVIMINKLLKPSKNNFLYLIRNILTSICIIL